MRLLFFIGSLKSGGKERRLVELLSYLKQTSNYTILVVTAYQGIDYSKFFDLDIENLCLNKKSSCKSVKVFFELDKIVKNFRPNIIHTWGSMPTFYMIPSTILRRIPLINSQITDAPPHLRLDLFSRFVNTCNFHFSSVILANSFAGLKSYKKEKSSKSAVIYNGMRMDRFHNLENIEDIKNKYGIHTQFAVIMTASFSALKDWDRFYEVAKYVTQKKSNISFVGAGAVVDNNLFKRITSLSKDNQQIILPGRTAEVENLVNACDVGVLFSINGEGVSNSILEYMALAKPVVVDECGGTPEFVKEGVNGFFTSNRTTEQIGDLIIQLCEDKQFSENVGIRGKETVYKTFTIEKMGEEFEKLYSKTKKIFNG